MSSSKLTLIGMFNYDETLFDLMNLPDGIDKELVVENILLKGGEYEVLYADIAFMKSAINVWSRKWNRTFLKWKKALDIEYSPLENYDRIEEWTVDTKGAATKLSSTEASGESFANGNDASGVSSLNKVSAYDSFDFQNKDSNSSTSTGETHSDSTFINNSTLNDTDTHTDQEVKKGRARGNIGVTTSQQMLESELNIAAWNLYEHIADIFLREFVLPIL